MANKAGAHFDEPKAPAAGASAAATTAVAAPAATPAAATVAPAAPPAATTVATAAAATPGGDAPPLYTQLCQTCHASGVANAPKLGDKAAWAPRIAEAKTIDGLTAVAIKGKGAMPPKGGSTASDDEIKAVVAYMVNSVK
jgi:cytochrome c5